MKKTVVAILAFACLVPLWAFTNVQAFEIITRDMVEKEVVTKTDLIKTVDNFIILFDTSGSTNEMVPGRNVSKIQAAKAMLKERNEWFPELGQQAGLYIYTNRLKKLDPVFPMQVYNRDRFGAAIDRLPDEGSGPTMMVWGLSGLRDVFSGLSGKTAVIMFTDGTLTESNKSKRPYQIAQENARDNDVCFYLVSSATADRETKVVEAVSKINSCSRVIPLTQFLDNPLYLTGALFTVKTTAYERLTPVTQVVGVVANDMLFDYNSSAIRSEYNEKLDMLGDYLQKNPDAYVVAGGFADSTGEEEYNLALSERRAASVKDYLVNTFSVDADRIVTLWFGELNPVADNATDEGRQLNRRVEIAVGGVN